MGMASSDEPRDEDAQGGLSYDEALFVPGPRRSTYRPPVGFPPPPPARRPPEPAPEPAKPVEPEPEDVAPVETPTEESEQEPGATVAGHEPDTSATVGETEAGSEAESSPAVASVSPAAFLPKLTYTPPAEPVAPPVPPLDLAAIFAPPPFVPPAETSVGDDKDDRGDEGEDFDSGADEVPESTDGAVSPAESEFAATDAAGFPAEPAAATPDPAATPESPAANLDPAVDARVDTDDDAVSPTIDTFEPAVAVVEPPVDNESPVDNVESPVDNVVPDVDNVEPDAVVEQTAVENADPEAEGTDASVESRESTSDDVDTATGAEEGVSDASEPEADFAYEPVDDALLPAVAESGPVDAAPEPAGATDAPDTDALQPSEVAAEPADEPADAANGPVEVTSPRFDDTPDERIVDSASGAIDTAATGPTDGSAAEAIGDSTEDSAAAELDQQELDASAEQPASGPSMPTTGSEAVDPWAPPAPRADIAPEVPQRHSLSDAELTEELERTVTRPGATLDAIDELERQLKLRDEEARRYQEWEQSMLAVGTPEAIATVEEVRPQFEGVVFPTQSIPIQYPQGEAPATTDEQEPENPNDAELDEPVPEAEAEPEATVEGAPEQPVSPFAPPPSFYAPPALVEPPTPPSVATVPDSWLVEETIQPGSSAADYVFEPPSEAYPDVDPFGDLPTPIADEEPSADETPEPGDTFEPNEAEDADPAPDDAASAPDAPGEFTTLLFVEPTITPDKGTETVEPESDSPSIQELLFGEAPAEVPEAPVQEPEAPEPEPEPEPVAPATLVAPVIAPVRIPVFETEELGAEPTPIDRRVGKAVRLFWLWFAANSSIISVAFGAILFSLGMSLRQAVIATLAGVVLSFLPLGLGTLAGKRSGQPTMIVSRATFGVRGNVVPAVVALASRIFWGAALMWVLATSVASALIGAGLNGTASYAQLTIVSLGATFVIALVIAFFGYQLLARFQLVVSVLSAILVIGLITMTWQYVDISRAMTAPDGSLSLVVTGAVLVFSFVGLAWANSSGDLARYQGPSTSSGRSMLSATFGTTLPTFVLIAYGALLAASDPTIASGLVDDPLNALGALLPAWYPSPLIAATVLSLLSGVVISIYSGSFAIAAVGIRMKQTVSTLLVAVLVFALGWLIASIGGDLTTLFRDFATTLAVPVAAWVGLFAAEIMIRSRSYDSVSLLKLGGVYPAVRWVNLSALVLITAIGWAFTMSTIDWLSWQGYLAKVIDNPVVTDLATADIGVIVALVLGLIVPLATGVSAIRSQEGTSKRVRVRKQEVVEVAPN